MTMRPVPILLLLILWTLPAPLLANEHDRTDRQQATLSALLLAPIDLPEFKRIKGPSNSSVMHANRDFYKPDREGFYYWYALFKGPSKQSESKRLRGFRLIVYKYGTEAGDFYDRNEELIAIKSRFSDPHLGKLNLVGVSVDSIRKRFGAPFAAIDGLLIYHDNSHALSLGSANGSVKWFKYVRLHQSLVDADNIPAALLKF